MAKRRNYKGTITAEVEVEIADILEEIDTDDLQEELNSRKKVDNDLGENTPKAIICRIKELLSLREFHTKDRIIQEISELYELM